MVKELKRGKWQIYWRLSYFGSHHFDIYHQDMPGSIRAGELMCDSKDRGYFGPTRLTIWPKGFKLVDDDLKSAVEEIIESV